MPDRTFEMELERLFGDHPAFADADLFALRVETSLERGWVFRNLLIGALGLVGGLLCTAQLMASGFWPRLQELAAKYAPDLEVRWTDVALSKVLPGGLEVNGEVLWMSAILAAVAVGFAVARAIREI